MSYEEAQSKTKGDGDGSNNGNDDGADDSWEKIEKEEAESSLKRKALDRNDTSFTVVEKDVAAKRQKDTPSVSLKIKNPLAPSRCSHEYPAFPAGWRRTTRPASQKASNQLFRIRILRLSLRLPQNRLPCSCLARRRPSPGSR